MKIETLRKSHKKQIVIGVVAVCIIGGALTFNLTRAKYRLTQSMKLVTGTINYKVPDLRIVALYTENDNNEYVESDDVPTSGYTLNEEKSLCRVYDGTTSVAEAPIDTKASITYQDGLVTFANISKKNTRCYLYFDKYVEPTSEDTLAKLGITGVVDQTETVPDFSQIATTDEGLFRTEDGMYEGKSIYWRGASTTNHVIFANKCWRIIRINGDGSIRLIYNGATNGETKCNANPTDSVIYSSISSDRYYATSNGIQNDSSYVGWTYKLGYQRPSALGAESVEEKASNAKFQTEKWFNANIIGDSVISIADGKFCNDRNTKTGNTWNSQPSSTFYYAAYERLVSAKTPTLSCSKEDIYTLKVGAITADEVAFAGGVYNVDNSKYFLKGNKYYWTMSPFSWKYGSAKNSDVFRVYSNGRFTGFNDTYNDSGIRPVINLKLSVNIAGSGTPDSPYVVS